MTTHKINVIIGEINVTKAMTTNELNYNTKDLLSAREAAEELGCVSRTVRNLRERGELKGIQLNGQWFVTKKSVQAYKERAKWGIS